MNHKTIKLFGGPHDGSIVEILHSAKSYRLPIAYPDGWVDETIYRETNRRASNDEVIFSCYGDDLCQLH